jgi:hypothetical protein
MRWLDWLGSRHMSLHRRHRGIVELASLGLLALTTLACAPDMPPADTGPIVGFEQLEGPYVTADGFEFPPVHIAPASILPPELLEGPSHRVTAVRLEPGFVNTYLVGSHLGPIEVRGIGMLRKRIYEIEVLDDLDQRDLGSSEVYALSVANAAAAPVEGSAQFLLHPVKSTANLPRGMWAMARGMYEMNKFGRTYLEDDYIDEMVGFGKAKRAWAYRLGVDPYTDNPHMQRLLNRNGWISLAGGMTVRLPLFAVPAGGASYALTVASQFDGMKREVRDKAPEDIRIAMRPRLLAMGVSETAVTKFLYHPWYSPSRQVVIVESLEALTDAANRSEFIELAVRADEPYETFSFARMALMLSAYHRFVSPLDEIFSSNGLPMAHTMEGNVILPLYIDAGFWTERMAWAADEVDRFLDWDREIGGKEILVSGTLSARARGELQRRGWSVSDGLEASWLAEFDGETYVPGGPDEDRILPEIGG